MSEEEIDSQGFVTVSHSVEDLREMNEVERHIIAKENDQVDWISPGHDQAIKMEISGAVSRCLKNSNRLIFWGSPYPAINYIVVGQVCIAKEYRGQSLLDKCYAAYKEHFHDKFDFAITEIAASNLRSLKAHARIGFREINQYEGPDGQSWKIVAWDWK